jgi:hypothetical protein
MFDKRELSEAELDRSIAIERVEFSRLVARKEPGDRAFIVRDRIPDKQHSRIMTGSKENGWGIGFTCYDGDHRDRANAYCNRFNAARHKKRPR